MSTTYNDVWKGIFESLPQTPTDAEEKGMFPIPEIVKTIFFCLSEQVEDFDTAMKLLDVLSPLRSDIEFLNWKAMVEYDAKKYLRAFDTTEALLKLSSDPGIYFNAGRTAYKANKLQKSEEYLRKAIQLSPGEFAPLLDYAVTICTMGDFDGALKVIENIDTKWADERNRKIVEFNKGWHYIRKGNFKQGIDLLHLGREINVWGSHAGKYKNPMWDGETYPGKTIMIIGEGGIGDEVINARFASIIRSRGMIPIMSTIHKNESMLSSIITLEKVISNNEVDKEPWDYWVPCMDLPYILKIDSTEIPSKPFLSAKPAFVEKWAKKIHSNKKLKIGIRWMGNPRYELELARTIPIEYFESLLGMDVQLYSIQMDDEKKGLQFSDQIIDLTPDLKSWDDTMGAMMNFDLVITSCTSIGHVAGALGVPTWVVTPLLPYYTWADMKKDSYWYDSLKLYRQKVWKNWDDPFVEIKHDLKQLLK